jgi:hypothetical protein
MNRNYNNSYDLIDNPFETEYDGPAMPPNLPPGIVEGEPDPGKGFPSIPPAPEKKPEYGKAAGKYANLLEGWDTGKLNSEHASPKYMIGRTLSNFDPRAGITGEVLEALNSLGLGTFTGQGDKAKVSGNVDPRFEGWTEFDFSRDFGNPDNPGNWQYGASNPNMPAQRPGSAGGLGTPMQGYYGGLVDQFLGMPPLKQNLVDFNLPYTNPVDISQYIDDPLVKEMLQRQMNGSKEPVKREA